MDFRSISQTPAIARLAHQIRIAYWHSQSWRVAARECQIWTADRNLNPRLAQRIAEEEYMPSPATIERLRTDGALVFCEDAPTMIIDMSDAEVRAAFALRRPMPDHIDPRIIRAFVDLGWLQPMRGNT